MSLSSIQLDAFITVAREKNFSKAAHKLHITQSALSQRIANLEQALGATLFLREPAGVMLTELGLALLRYCQIKEGLEADFLTRTQSAERETLSGMLRIAGFSTITQSMLMPVLAKFVKKHPAVQMNLLCRELRELPGLLMSGQADFIFLTQPLQKQGIENYLLGYEEYLLIQPKNRSFREDVYLDHDEEDTSTLDFFNIQTKPPKTWRRSFLDEIYLIIAGVQAGMGRAVVPWHIAKNSKDIEIVKGYKPLKIPVYFTYYNQTFYTRLHQLIIMEFTNASRDRAHLSLKR